MCAIASSRAGTQASKFMCAIYRKHKIIVFSLLFCYYHFFVLLLLHYHYLIRTYSYVCTFTKNVCLKPTWISWLIHQLLTLHIIPLRVEPHCQLPLLLVHWSYREWNTHTILYNYRDVHQLMHRKRSLQWLHLQAEQRFWGFIRRCQVKHILPL